MLCQDKLLFMTVITGMIILFFIIQNSSILLVLVVASLRMVKCGFTMTLLMCDS